MNERIRLLANQAGAAQQHAEYVTPQGLEWFDNFKEKFAELIVRECAITAYLCSHADCHSGDEFIHAGDKIKEHFGVEE